MLPCEFCEELYPEELLIDHQVGCELLGLWEECVQAVVGGAGHVRFGANYWNMPVVGAATVCSPWCDWHRGMQTQPFPSWKK